MTRAAMLLIAGLIAAGCTSDPDAAVNQTAPIRQMDSFFNSLTAPSAARPRDYTHMRGYAPAYPPYDESVVR
jgi:hypothetical protein